MSAWPGKFVIGLTGNIATGKSEVRHMLETLGAFGIDADALAHQAITRGEPAYEAVSALFGSSILLPDGEINRPALGVIVFSDPSALAQLEAIIHPQVRKRVNFLIDQSNTSIIVIEAIKLIESGYPKLCDSIWVTYAPLQVQLKRLIEKRGMNKKQALQRIRAQPAQDQKLAVADVIIRNDGDLDNTWQQVQTYWDRVIPSAYR